MIDPCDWSAGKAAAAIRNKKLSCEELVRSCLAGIERREPIVRAFVDLKPEAALQRAHELDQRRPRADEPLFGVPVAIKEVFDVAGFHCPWGTPIHAERVPIHDAPAVARLIAAGAIVLGTTVSTEYAIAAAGPTSNPHDSERTPGGSSSGSAAAVAAHFAPLALGSQTIGSTIRPSVYCGVLGLKPTRGAISTRGVMPLAPELDHVGAIARNVDDLLLACRVLFGSDVDDPASDDIPPPHAAPSAQRVVELIGPFHDRIQPASAEAVNRALAAFRKRGIAVERLELPASFERIGDLVWTLVCKGLATHHSADDEREGGRMSARMRELVERGRAIGASEQREAASAAVRFANELRVILGPGAVVVQAAVDDIAPRREEGTGSPALQALWTVTGFPTVSVPCGLWQGLPIGVQMAAPPMHESSLLATARLLIDGLDV